MESSLQDWSSADLALQNRGQSFIALILVSISYIFSKFDFSKRLSSSLGDLIKMTGFHHRVF